MADHEYRRRDDPEDAHFQRPVKRRRYEDDDDNEQRGFEEQRRGGDRHGTRHNNDESSRRRSRSPQDTTRHRSRPVEPIDSEEQKERHHHRRRHHHHQHHRSSRAPLRPTAAVAAELPYGARQLHRADLETFRPLLARYLDVQKNKQMADLDEREVRGRWKSFLAKWNEGTLAQSWYDPELFVETKSSGLWNVTSRPTVKDVDTRQEPLDAQEDREDLQQRAGASDAESGDGDDGDDYGPILPGGASSSSKAGPGIPSLQDLEVRREMNEEDRADAIAQLRLERKADRAEQKARLEELVPRAEAGTRERKLEKKKEVNEKMKGFREKSPGGDMAVPDGELMGGGDGIEELKRLRASVARKKTEKEIRREEILRAKNEEREARMREYREKEDRAMVLLKELAKQRYG